MTLHGNGALSLKKRRLLCRRVVDEEWSLTEAAARSPSTAATGSRSRLCSPTTAPVTARLAELNNALGSYSSAVGLAALDELPQAVVVLVAGGAAIEVGA
jgi:hypothetical protein